MHLLKTLLGSDFDFYALLATQAEGVCEGIALFTSWPEASPNHHELVFAAEDKSDQQRTAVNTALSEAFSTPFDREDIEDLSHMLDTIMDRARRAASEMSALQVYPDECQRSMFKNLREAVEYLATACSMLRRQRQEAYKLALAAKKVEYQIQEAYEAAMRDLFKSDDVLLILKRREVYRLTLDVSVQVAEVAEFLRHLIVKLV